MARFQFMLVKTNAVLYNGIRQLGGVPKWLKGLASNTSRSVVPARGFKSPSLRHIRTVRKNGSFLLLIIVFDGPLMIYLKGQIMV